MEDINLKIDYSNDSTIKIDDSIYINNENSNNTVKKNHDEQNQQLNNSKNQMSKTFQNDNTKFLNNQNNNKDLKESLSLKFAEDRRYNNENIKSGKSLFLERYIFNESKKKVKNKHNSIKRISTNINSNFPEERIKEMEEAIKKHKITEIFSKKLDKSIFSFNLKKYDNCYNELYNSEIIFNENEFAEFLLVINGLDTFIIGDFLAKDKGLNSNFVILKTYMKKINFKGMSFLNAIRFLLSRLNLPKDAGLILNIINEFTIVYYNDNNPSENYKDSDSLYLLASTIFALNTMFIRTDIKNMNVIKKEEFISMNQSCNKDYVSNLYDELKNNPLDVKHDYHEIIYKRFVVTGKAKVENKDELNHNNISDNESKEYLSMIKQGQNFLKYGNYASPHERFFQLSKDENKLIWKSTSNCCSLTPKKSVNIKNIKNVYLGLNSSKVFERYKIPLDYDQNCFSIVLNKGTIDLRNESDGITKKWFHAIKFLIKRNKGLTQFKKNKPKDKNENKEETIEIIWRTEILLKWELYRKYLIKRTSSLELYHNISEQSKKSFNQKVSGIFQKMKNNKIEDNNFEKILLNKSEFYHLWTLGIPSFLRKRIWPIIIGNELSITENFVDHYVQIIEKINFEEYNQLYQDHLKNKKNEDPILSEDFVLNEMLNDILKISNTIFGKHIDKEYYDINSFSENLFKIVRIFILYRQDVNYSQQLVYISAILLLNSENYFQAFVNLANFIIPSCLIKFLKNKKDFVEIRTLFFTNLLEQHTPLLKTHLEKLGVKHSIYLSQWLDYVFIKAFNYQTVLRLWDVYLLKGEIFLYEIAISILKMEEKDLLNLPLSLILERIKHIPEKYTEDEFFNILNQIDIYQQFKFYINDVNIGYEKGILMQAHFND